MKSNYILVVGKEKEYQELVNIPADSKIDAILFFKNLKRDQDVIDVYRVGGATESFSIMNTRPFLE